MSLIAGEKSETFKLPLKLLLGPFFFASAMAALLLKESSISFWATTLALSGFMFSWLFRKKGFAISCSLLFVTNAYWAINKELTFWDIELSLAFIVSWFISYFALNRYERFFTEGFVSLEKQQIESSKLQHTFDFIERNLKDKVERLESEKKTLLEKLEKKTLEKSFPVVKEEPTSIQDTQEYKTVESSLHLLKEQFEEKSHVLNETRKQLFLKENELLALAKEKVESDLLENEVIEKLQQVLKENQELCEENEKLYDLLDSLLKIKKQRYTRLKPLRKKKSEDSLFDSIA